MKTEHFIGFANSRKSSESFRVHSAFSDEPMPGDFPIATEEEVLETVQKASHAFLKYSVLNGRKRGEFLRKIATKIEALGEPLIQRIQDETGLVRSRILNEKARTIYQLQQFAALIEEGHWVNATIDQSNEEGAPDLRKMLAPLGSVVIFGAGNFPLAYSTAGGDTAAALAAGNTVIVKAHPNHAGTNALIAEAIDEAAKETGMPDGVFSTLYDDSYEVGSSLVMHDDVSAVGFTGSEKGGRALMDLAARRKAPIPVFAEMGSTNPVFILDEPDMGIDQFVSTLSSAIVNDMGQFCTQPGIIFILDDQFGGQFETALVGALEKAQAGVFLNKGIKSNFLHKHKIADNCGVKWYELHRPQTETNHQYPILGQVDLKEFLSHPQLREEIFGPLSLVVKCASKEEMLEGASILTGQLTATIVAKPATLTKHSTLIHKLRQKAGRVIFNGVPTGVRVCAAMNHGGPYPASSDVRFSAVGADSIIRFTRPITFQNCPQELLPSELKDDNPLKLIRRVNGKLLGFNQ